MATSRQRPTRCIFCGRGDLTDEDAIPQWIGRMFSRGGTRRAQTMSGQELTRRNIGAQLVVRHVVCGQHCNSGWMSRLQTQAKPFLEPMILGHRIVIGPEAQRVLTAWATMTTMVLDFAEPPMSDPIYEQQQRTEFYRDRRIPAISNVWLAHRESLPTVAVVRWQIDACHVTTQPIDPSTLGVPKNVYASTAVFGHLILQLLWQRPDGSTPDLARLWSVEDEWGVRHMRFRVFPLEVPIAWPPPLPLQEAEIEAFAERWARL